jgi:type II secretory pathway pseudopilin PulG
MSRFYRDRRRAQAGTTLVELLVALVIIGLALVLIVGTFSTGLLDAAVAKRNSAAQAVIQSELESISGAPFDSSAQSYSECFATEVSDPPVLLPSYLDPCPGSAYTLRADVVPQLQQPTPTTQTWTVTVVTWPDEAPAGGPVQTVKADR